MAANDRATINPNPNPEHDEPAEEQPGRTQAETAAGSKAEHHDDDRSPEELKAEIDRLRKAQAETNRKALADRRRIEELDRQKQEKEDAKLGDAERAQKAAREAEQRVRDSERRAEEAERRLVEKTIDQAIERAASGVFIYPDVAARCVDRTRIEHDPETGKVSGVKEALDRLLRDYPEMARTSKGGGSPAAMTTRRGASGQAQPAKEPGLREYQATKVGIEPM